MPMAPSKWARKSARNSTEQRDRAKKRGRFRARKEPAQYLIGCDPSPSTNTLWGNNIGTGTGTGTPWLNNMQPAAPDITWQTIQDAANRLATNNVPPIGNAYPAPADHTHGIGRRYNIGGNDYVLTEQITNRDHINFYRDQIQLKFQSITNNAYTIMPTTYAGTNQMAISQHTNQIWDTWQTPTYGTGSYNNYQTYNPYQPMTTELTWQGWINETARQNIPGDWIADRAAAELNQQFRPAVPLTPEQIEANRVAEDQRRHQMALQRERQDRMHAEARILIEQANERATATFVEHLSSEDRETYEKERCIYVRSQHGRRYRISCATGQSGNVDLLDHRGQRTASFCVHPPIQPNGRLLPNADAWFTQKLYLEHDEDHFIEKANMTFGQRPTRELITPAHARGEHHRGRRLVAA